MKLHFIPVLLILPAAAELRVNSLFTDHMVVQRDKPIRVWGWDDPGQQVTVTLGDATATATAGEGDGRWQTELPGRPASTEPLTLKLSGSSEKTVNDVLVGEVWLCSGQSNMGWTVQNSLDFDLEMAAENEPLIRLIKIPNVGSQELRDDFEGSWRVADSPDAVRNFSAVGYYFGKILAETLGDVPIGLVDNAWGGSAAEAWIRRDVFEADERNQAQIGSWRQFESSLEEQKAKYQKAFAEFQARQKEAKAGNQPFNERPPEDPDRRLKGNQRPGNLYGGVLNPVIGYTLRGVIWYQGESNAGRADNYATLFPSMITHWRDVWGQGDFSFYWAQLADFMQEQENQPADSNWARLRDSQTAALSLPNTGQAVIIDTGEADDIHPPDKLTVAKRLVRHALKKDYGFSDLSADSPRYESHEIEGDKIQVTFDTAGASLDTSDTKKIKGFAIAGEDMQWQWADAKIVADNRIAVSHPEIAEPKHVRYAWSDNPVNNLQNQFGLPATPFRTDE